MQGGRAEGQNTYASDTSVKKLERGKPDAGILLVDRGPMSHTCIYHFKRRNTGCMHARIENILRAAK